MKPAKALYCKKFIWGLLKMLDVKGLESGYGETQVLFDLSFTAHAGKVHALLGRNGAGKSTTLKTIMGLVKPKQGRIALEGTEIQKLEPYTVAGKGIAYVPETRDIFPSLTVLENLELTAKRYVDADNGGQKRWTIERVFDVFPRLSERANNFGNELSGGEQQMLTIARALLMNPKLLILDEPTEGLAPIIVKQIHAQLKSLKETGLTIILVEQNFGFAVSLADDVSVVGKGQIVWQGSPEEIKANTEVQKQWLGV